MPTYQEIIINWTALMKVEELSKMGLSLNNVLYQLYGDSQLYGRGVLLYIGKATNAETRLDQHIKSVFGRVNNFRVSIGTLENFDGKLEIPESILIANHKPSFNKEYIHDIDPEAKKEKIILINNGTPNMLNTSTTNFWWVGN